MSDGLVFERYRLTLTHEMVSAKGGTHLIEDPIETEYVVDRRMTPYGESILINDMLRRLVESVLWELKWKRGEQND